MDPPSGDVYMRDVNEPDDAPRPRHIHITVCKVPTTYEAVLSLVPSFHARPPVLPEHDEPLSPNLPPHENGFDLCLHIGVAGRGPLRVERMGHKKGYNMKDASGKLAPIVPVTISTEEDGPTARPAGSGDAQQTAGQKQQEKQTPFIPAMRVGSPEPESIAIETSSGDIPARGLGKGYEAFDDEIHTDIDALKLVHFLKETGFEVMSTTTLCILPTLTPNFPGYIHIYGCWSLSM